MNWEILLSFYRPTILSKIWRLKRLSTYVATVSFPSFSTSVNKTRIFEEEKRKDHKQWWAERKCQSFEHFCQWLKLIQESQRAASKLIEWCQWLKLIQESQRAASKLIQWNLREKYTKQTKKRGKKPTKFNDYNWLHCPWCHPIVLSQQKKLPRIPYVMVKYISELRNWDSHIEKDTQLEHVKMFFSCPLICLSCFSFFFFFW